jgi:ATP-dependent DNA helicase RecQ
MIEQAKEALKKYFGYDAFRPLQEEIMEAVFAGNDSVVLMPTGGGKSICFQVPAIVMEGTALVVSPLISLMKDQVEGLRANGVKAAFLNSTLDAPEQRQIEDDLYNGNLDLIYVSPERLTSRDFSPLLKGSKINLIAIDEAHCISSWGHDFRPEYTQLKFLKESLPGVPVMALTATADKTTRIDIEEQLRLEEPKRFIASFDRPNLYLEMRPGQKRLEQILRFIRERPNTSGIIYCLSRKNTENLAEKLQAKGINAKPYHAGLSSADRSAAQEAFINDETPVICATVAFGMGIDKSNVRWIIHYNLPKNMESYYQEIGRAGRDGAPADTLLFYSYADVSLLKDILSKNESDQTEVKLAKLDRMYSYASSQICRRRTLLSYFGEDLKEDCGHCDVCKNPPEYIDGTEIAQKALSAVARLRQQVGVTMLIDVLRGSGRREVMEKGYHQIKTFGLGRNISARAWRNYIDQFLHMGLLEIPPRELHRLQLTDASKEVLFDNRQVKLVDADQMEKRAQAAKEKAKKEGQTTLFDGLFEQLRQLRLQLARQRGIPPYRVFTDATLREMAEQKPITDEEMQAISGVGERKLFLYGNHFLEVIKKFIREESGKGRKVPGATYLQTLQLYQEGHTAEEIAEQRDLNINTVYSHLSHLYEKGEAINLDQFVSPTNLQQIMELLNKQKPPFQLKDLHEALGGEIPYHQIRFGLAHFIRKSNEQVAKG